MVQEIISWDGFYSRSYRLLGEHNLGKVSFELERLFAELENIHSQNPSGEGHWEFLAIALLHSFDKSIGLSLELNASLSRIKKNFVHKPQTANWRLMSRIVHVRLLGRRLLYSDLLEIGLNQHIDGLLPDHPRDNSTQYHAYLLLLILRFGDLDDRRLSALVHTAFEWLFTVYHELGDPSPLGRGRFQIFGYASMVAAANLASDWGVKVPEDWLYAAQTSMTPEAPTGALSAYWTGPHRNHLLHGYNSTCDYAEFASFWTGVKSGCATRLADSTKPIYLHTLRSHAVMASFNRRPFLVVAPDPSETYSRRQLIRSLLFRQESSETLPPKKLQEHHDLPGGFHLRQNGATVDLTLSPQQVEAKKHVSFSIWHPEHVPAETTASRGSVEVEQLKWERGGQRWSGLHVRAVRHGEFRINILL